ncbi:MAG: hypothetical protein K2V38_25005 [Gemmataceae bacterium]|nr:hypothetical protein [Gemmataceae bacterium]
MQRRMLLSALVVLAAVGLAAADPPGLQPTRRAEARELDPVAREFHLPDAAVEPASPVVAEEALAGAVLRLLLSACETLAGEFTMPLGGAAMPAPEL